MVTAPNGMHTVAAKNEDAPAGVVFVLKNINDGVNVDDRNRIHLFYMVYISEAGEILCDYLNLKKLLDTVRHLCRGKDKPEAQLCRQFNEETDDGRNLKAISKLLSQAIDSIIDVKEESDIIWLPDPRAEVYCRWRFREDNRRKPEGERGTGWAAKDAGKRD